MASSGSQAQVSQVKRASFGSFQGGSASIFLDKSRSGIRGSTPDSEALASSDDEQDHSHRLHPVTRNPTPKPNRRSSWLAEAQQSPIHKGSLGSNVPFSPTSPSSAVASGDQMNWGAGVGSAQSSTIGRGHPGNASFPWANTIWNNDSQRGPPQRLTEVLPSPTSMTPSGSAGLCNDESLRTLPMGSDTLAESSIPFAIPLQPTLKTYRSQSYSVGQLDPESSNLSSSNHTGYGTVGRSRNGAPYAGLQHRPSRPSMLSDLSHDSSLLGQLREVEDDEESSKSSESAAQISNTQARTIEQLALENAMLRQAAAEQFERENARHCSLPATKNVAKSSRTIAQISRQGIRDSVPEQSEYALCDVDDLDTVHPYSYEGSNGRSSTEYSRRTGTRQTMAGAPENRTVESVKKGHWQSSLGFGGIGEPPQSRRHSFADVPTRQNSIGSISDQHSQAATTDAVIRSNGKNVSPGVYREGLARPFQGEGSEYTQFLRLQSMQEQLLELQHLRDRNFAVSYFSRTDPPHLRSGEGYSSSLSSSNVPQMYVQNQHSRSQHIGHSPRPYQLLYMVTFKAQRADVFYVQEGTGLQVRKGDLVIVEADRGADLGTVASENMALTDAKEMRDKFMQEHYQWLMVFSRHGQNGTVAGPNPNGQPSSSSSTIGSMGGSPGQSCVQDLPSSELKPKMIKRLAQPHEIQTLRDKEGNEAKAKRVCQQKVIEHRLNMEILEAEFQVDWKKLTFYYFADEYINFNSLVTDLFKIYKTRIWMSAINPASFQTPLGGLQIPGGVGATTTRDLGPDLDRYSGRRPQRQQLFPASTATTQQALGASDHPWGSDRDGAAINSLVPHRLHGQNFPGNELDVGQLDHFTLDYRQGVPQVSGINSPYTSFGYHNPDVHTPLPFGPKPNSSDSGPHSSPVPGRDWTQSFQGLSLGH